MSSGEFARVLVDSPLPHLDRLFDYSIPNKLAESAQRGVRVRVMLAGSQHDGFIVERTNETEHTGRLLPLLSVVSPIPVLTDALARLCRLVADHYAGSMSDVVRLAVPPRNATAERASGTKPDMAASDSSGGGFSSWGSQDRQVAEFVGALSGAPKVAWNCPPAQDWEEPLAELVAAVAQDGSGSLVILPDWRDVDRLALALEPKVDQNSVAMLRAGLGPQARYAQYLQVLRGDVNIVLGTRAAAFAPLPNLRLCVIWDDGDSNHAEQRAPYPHARDVLAIRSHDRKVALVCAGYARTPEVQRWVESGWLRSLEPDRESIRNRRPQVAATEDTDRSPFDTVVRIPPSAVATLRQGLRVGPVLVQVARRGYIPTTACANCREIASCPNCAGPLSLSDRTSGSGAAPGCLRCGSVIDPWSCPDCGGSQLRAVAIGAGRTAHDLGHLLPGVPIHISTADHPIENVPAVPAIVVATSGLEPRAEGRYQAGFLPDAQSELWRGGATAREEAVRRWFNAAALLRPGAPLRIAADPTDPAIQAMIRWDPAAIAADELHERTELRLPPAVRLVKADGRTADIAALQAGVETQPGLQVLGPITISDSDDLVRVVLTADDGRGLIERVRHVIVARATARLGQPIRVQVDATDLDR